MQSELREVAAVVDDQAFAFLVDGGMFDKLAVRLPESGDSITGLLHKRVLKIFFWKLIILYFWFEPQRW
jgi:hypothetical protein